VRWIDRVSMNLREVVGGSSVLALVTRPPLGGLRPQSMSRWPSHAVTDLYGGFVLVGCCNSRSIFFFFFLKLKIYKTPIELEPPELDWSLGS
jgi:hypothetical protein